MSPSNFASRSQIFTTHSVGGGGGSSPTGAGDPAFASRSNVFTVPKGAGGGLFAHGIVVQNAEATWRGKRPGVNDGFWRTPLWDPDGYMSGSTYPPKVPTGLGGIYLLLATIPYEISIQSGWWLARLELGPNASLPRDRVGQWQQGYRAAAAIGGTPYLGLVWIGVLQDNDYINWATDFNPSVRSGEDVTLSAFRLGAVGEEGFHGALMYRTDTSYLGNDNPGMCGATLFDTDDYVGTGDVGDIDSNGFGIPSGLGGVYFYCTTYTFQVKNMAPFAPNPPYWPYGYDFALIPVLTDLVSGSYTNPPYGSLPDNSYNRWPSQSELGGADINDIGINNTMAITSFWIGRIEDGGFASVIPIPDFSSAWDDEQVWLHDTDPALSYQALIRIAE